MLYIDAPYGLRYATWDHKKFDSADYIRLFKQMAAMTDRDNWIAVVWSDHFSLPDVNKAMLEQNFKNTNNVFWYKFNQNQEGTHNLTNAVESGTVGFKDEVLVGAWIQWGEWGPEVMLRGSSPRA